MPEKDMPSVGSDVIAIDSPLDESFGSTLSKGIISAIRYEDEKKYIQSDLNGVPGNSGGPN